jgi:hypothetical protein
VPNGAIFQYGRQQFEQGIAQRSSVLIARFECVVQVQA